MPIIPNDHDHPKEQPLHDQDREPDFIHPDPPDPAYEINAELPGNDPTPGRRKPKTGII